MGSTSRAQIPRLAPSWWIRAGGGGALNTVGSRAAHAWLGDRDLALPGTRWHVAIGLDVRDEPAVASFDEATDTRFHIEIYAEEWGYFFCHAGRASWIRVTDQPFVHMRDDYGLLASTPTLDAIGTVLRAVEKRHELRFRRDLAFISTSLANAEPSIRKWVESL